MLERNDSLISNKSEQTDLTPAEQYFNDWYVAYVASGKEEKMKAFINLQFSYEIKGYVPKRILRERKCRAWHNQVRILFPGYIFLNGNIDEEKYYELKSIPGIWKIIKYGNDLLPISNMELKALMFFVNGGKPIDRSLLLKTGKIVIVVDGPLAGMEGNILKIDHRKGRAKVKLTFLGEERIIDFGVELLVNKSD